MKSKMNLASVMALSVVLLASCADAKEQPAQEQKDAGEASSASSNFGSIPSDLHQLTVAHELGLGFVEAWTLDDLDVLFRDKGMPLHWWLEPGKSVIHAKTTFTGDDGAEKEFEWVFDGIVDGEWILIRETRVNGRKQLPESTFFAARLMARDIAEAYYPENLETAGDQFIEPPEG